jgi:hypothetical protein
MLRRGHQGEGTGKHGKGIPAASFVCVCARARVFLCDVVRVVCVICVWWRRLLEVDWLPVGAIPRSHPLTTL